MLRGRAARLEQTLSQLGVPHDVKEYAEAGPSSLNRINAAPTLGPIVRHAEPRSHGSLCRDLLVSTGAMTNRLDKLERSGLLTRKRDPSDRRGVLLELTTRGREKLDEYVELEAKREVELLTVLDPTEKQQLNRLLRKLMRYLPSELGSPSPG